MIEKNIKLINYSLKLIVAETIDSYKYMCYNANI